jgi:hypothetical protein
VTDPSFLTGRRPRDEDELEVVADVVRSAHASASISPDTTPAETG